MDDSFDRSHCPGFQRGTVHDRSVHPHHTVQLAVRSSSSIKEAGDFQESDRAFDCDDGWTSIFKDDIACGQCLGEAGRLCSSDRSAAGATMSEDNGARRFQLSRRSRTRW
jgi:hypothetical protein